MTDLFDPRASWIWLQQPNRDKNSYACFRRTIELPSRPPSARLRITADSRYELYVNGAFVGHGPVRSWPAPWPVDEYDIASHLTAGRNVVAVLVNHFGIGTFQYLHDQPGLIAQVVLDGRSIPTDSSWKALAHEGYRWPVPRITCQQAWEEQFDARVAPGLPSHWSASSFDDSAWTSARELRRPGQPPHETFEPRDIPMLTLDRKRPVAVLSTEVVRPADYSVALNPREFVNATDKSANHIVARMLLATFIHSDREQKIDLHLPHTRPFIPWKLNGEGLKFDDLSLQKTDTGVAHAGLKPGWNTLMVRLAESEHHFWANLSFWTAQPVTLCSRPDHNARTEIPWLAIGPFQGAQRHIFDTLVINAERIDPGATAQRFDDIWKRGTLTAEDLKEPFVRPMLPDMVATTDAYAICVSDRIEKSLQARVDAVEALTDDSSGWTTIHPTHDGAAVRILLDYGRETIGFQQFEIDAPAGAIVDVHNFEFIQKDGKFNLCESMNNSFRYVCAQGPQKYKTFLRRGFRYSWLTVRNFNRPVRLRDVVVLMSTYPQARRGAFECSDDMLTRIWEVGAHSVACCSEDTYTDCPTYEQTFWVGDARNEALVDLVANGDPRLSARCLRLTGRSLDRSSIAESQVPSAWQNLLPTWTFLWMRWTQEHYQLTGDAAFAREMLGFLDRNIAGMKKNLNDKGLFALYAWNMFDWAPMDTPADGTVTHINCLASLALKQSARLARDLGDTARADEWDTLARSLADAVNQHLWSEPNQAYLDCIRADGKPSPTFSQQTQTAAYLSGVATGARAERCRAIVHNPPKGFIKAGSPFFMFFLLEALVLENRHDEMIDVIRSYWGKQVEAGATTFWEMYHDGAKRLTRSHCHGWSAAPTYFLTQHVLGVQPLTPGYASVLVAPRLEKLAWARGRVPTPLGVVACDWKNTAEAFELSVTVPGHVPLRVELPLTGTVEIVEGKATADGGAVSASGPSLKLKVRK